MRDKRARILLAARRLFVRQGFHSTPTSAIAREASVANGTLFHYFPTKQELINTLYRETHDSFFTITTAGIEEGKTIKGKIRILWFNTVKWALNRPLDFLFIQQFSNSPFIAKMAREEITSYTRFCHDLFSQGQTSGTLKGIPTELLCQLFTYQQYGVIKFLLQHEDLQQNTSYLDRAFEFCWESISKT